MQTKAAMRYIAPTLLVLSACTTIVNASGPDGGLPDLAAQPPGLNDSGSDATITDRKVRDILVSEAGVSNDAGTAEDAEFDGTSTIDSAADASATEDASPDVAITDAQTITPDASPDAANVPDADSSVDATSDSAATADTGAVDAASDATQSSDAAPDVASCTDTLASQAGLGPAEGSCTYSEAASNPSSSSCSGVSACTTMVTIPDTQFGWQCASGFPYAYLAITSAYWDQPRFLMGFNGNKYRLGCNNCYQGGQSNNWADGNHIQVFRSGNQFNIMGGTQLTDSNICVRATIQCDATAASFTLPWPPPCAAPPGGWPQ